MADKYKYNPKTGKWSKSTSTDTKPKDTVLSNKKDTSTKKSGENLTSSNPSKKSATGKAEKEYNEIEINTLQGTLNYIVTTETVKLQAGDTVKLQGLGKFLSGNYYVKDVTRQFGSDGYTQSATVIKTDFGSKLKVKSKEKSKSKKVSSSGKDKKRTYKVKKGDTLWSIAKKYYGKGNLYTKIAKANSLSTKAKTKLKQGKKLIIP